MKKKLKSSFVALFMFVGISILGIEVKASTITDQFTNPFLSYSYVDTNNAWGNFEKLTRRRDNKVAYCIQPTKGFSGGNYTGFYNLSVSQKANLVGLTEQQLSKASLLAHFGYGYGNHNSDDWYVATQSLIWKLLGRNFSFTSRNNASNPWETAIATPSHIQSKMNEIENLVANYQRMPAFNTNYLEIGLNSSAVFTDASNNLSGYSVSNCENCNARIEGNRLIVTPTNNQSGSVTLQKGSSSWSEDFVVYTSSNSQNMMIPGIVDPINVKVSYKVLKGSLSIVKYDKTNLSCKPQPNSSLAGSIYGLYKSDGTFIKDMIIKENCFTDTEVLDFGDYYVQEKEAGKNYEVDPTKYSFTLNKETTGVSLILKDKIITGNLKLLKYDSMNNSCTSQGNAKLSGAIYGIYKEDGTLFKELTISQRCQATAKDIPVGNYYVKEIKAPLGYKLNEKKYPFQITKDNYKYTQNITVQDDVITTKLFINKTYLTESGVYPEIGAKFDIISKTNNTKVGSLVIDESGSASITLPYDEYIIRQTEGRVGYKISKDIEFIVNEESKENSYISILNEPYSARLKVRKKDQYGNSVKLSGIRFKIYDIDNKKYVCQSVTYPNTETLCEFKTNELGEFVTPQELFPGHYRLEEVEQRIAGYLWNSEKLEFEIGQNSNTVKDKDLGEILILDFVNQEVKGAIEFHKTGEQFVIENGNFRYEEKPLAKVVVGLYGENKKFIKKIETNSKGIAIFDNLKLGKYFIKELSTVGNHILDSKEYEITLKYKDQYTPIVYETLSLKNYLTKGDLEFTKTDLATSEPIPGVLFEVYRAEDDSLVFSEKTDENGKIIIKNLEYGKYYIIEKETLENYVLNEEKAYFEIKQNGEVIKVNMTNEKIKGDLEFTKTDLATSEPIPGVLFEVYRAEDDSLVFSGKTDENGKIIIKNLEYGKYYIIEKETLENYVLNEEKAYFEIKQNGEVIKVNRTNEKIKGDLEFTKTDLATSEPIPGVLFEVYRAEDDSLVFSGKTDENGKIIIKNLEYGKYYIIEKETLENYILNNEKVYFEIKQNNEIVKANMTNEKVKIPETSASKSIVFDIIGYSFITLGIGYLLYDKHKKK